MNKKTSQKIMGMIIAILMVIFLLFTLVPSSVFIDQTQQTNTVEYTANATPTGKMTTPSLDDQDNGSQKRNVVIVPDKDTSEILKEKTK